MNPADPDQNNPPAFPSQQAATPPEPAPPLGPDSGVGPLFEALLKDPARLIVAFSEKGSGKLAGKLLAAAALATFLFGLTLGTFAMHEQLWAAPLKILAGLLISALICLPSLYIFSALTGSTVRFPAVAAGLAACLALIGALLLGFAPVIFVFAQSTDSFGFMGALVLVAWLISFFVGTGFLLKLLKLHGARSTIHLRVWIGIFLLVTLQMSTTLRPLLGRSPDFLTNEKRFFLQHWNKVIDKNLGDKPAAPAEKTTPQVRYSPTPDPTRNGWLEE